MKKNEKIREYLLGNEETLLNVIHELNSYDYYCLAYLDFYENNEKFFNDFFETPAEAVEATQNGSYCKCDEYVKFNYDGYLYSCNKEEKTKKITENIIEVIDYLIEYHNDIEISDKNLKSLLEEE